MGSRNDRARVASVSRVALSRRQTGNLVVPENGETYMALMALRSFAPNALRVDVAGDDRRDVA